MLQRLKKILTPIDFSDYSIRAMDSAYELVKETGAELHVLHVVAPYFTIVERSREMVRERDLADQAEEELERLKKDRLEDSKKVTTMVMIGPPVAKIVEYAAENTINLILLHTHGRTGLEHMVIGSVAEKLARTAPCSVLVLRN